MYGSLHIYLTYFSWLVLSKSEIVKKSCPIDKDYVAGSPQTQTFAYDNGDRLISAAASGGSGGTYSETYTYNPVSGNLASKGGATYTYGDAAHKHAVTSRSGGWLYTYDANGNMLTRVGGGKTFDYAYDAEHHLTSVSGSTTASMVYDGDGNRVKATIGGTTTVFIGKHFEWTGSTSTLIKYFYAGTQRIAMKKGSTVYYLFGDHLGSIAITASSAGAKLGELRYKPWGESRYTWGTTYTSRHFTGQVNESALELYFFDARWYDAALGRFLQADSLIPEPGNPQAWDRYAYGLNAPTRYTDPTGHWYYDPGCDCLVHNRDNKNQHPEYLTYKNTALANQLGDNLRRNDEHGSNLNNLPKAESDFYYSTWEQPTWWDTNPQNPDYFVLMLNAGSPGLPGVSTSLTFDRYGRLYWGIGGNFGKSLEAASLNLTGGYVGSAFDDYRPDQGNLPSFLAGLTVNVSGGLFGGGGVTWSPSAGRYIRHTAWEFGAFIIPNVGISATYNWQIFDIASIYQ